MAHEVIMPALGMAQETGVLVRWLAAPGDRVTKGTPLIEVETDKAVQEVEAQASGILGAVSAEAGDEIPVGQVIGLIFAEGEAGAAGPAPVTSAKASAGTGQTDTAAAGGGDHRTKTRPPGPHSPCPRRRPDLAPGRATHLRPPPRLPQSAQTRRRTGPRPGKPRQGRTSPALPCQRPRSAQGDAGSADPEAQEKGKGIRQITARVAQDGVLRFIGWMQRDGGISVALGRLAGQLGRRRVSGCDRGSRGRPEP
jgi:pyruvate/2-oxoglutarate dehydrogenase complex dihydrolipoamide acyltransferase (E2) component